MAKSKKTPAKKSEAAAAPSTPAAPFNADAAAQSAAALLAMRARQGKSEALKSESAAFTKLKQSLTTPQVSATSILSDAGKPGKTPANSGFARQVGHNQTFGANAARTGVPRRTAG